MSEDLIKRSYAIYALCDGCPKQRQCNKDSEEWCEKGLLIRSAIPPAENEIIGKLKTAIENEEICKNCPTAERISGENLLGAMALGFSYGMEADRPQGEWIWSPRDADGTVSGCCSNCSFSHLFVGGHTAQYKFCPNCGADMRKETVDYKHVVLTCDDEGNWSMHGEHKESE